MHVTIFGTGYVGLVTGTCLAEVGNEVVCVDIDADKVARLDRGEVPIFEPGLEDLVAANRATGRLRFTTDAKAAMAHGQVVFIAVGTPPDEDGSADLSHVLGVAASIGRTLERHVVVVNKSTVPVGTADRVRGVIEAELAARGAAIEFDVVSNPEFLKEGDAVKDCMRPDRIVIGSGSARAVELLKQLYAPFNRNHERFVLMDVRSAELTKYAANAMLATRISFMNELANLAEALGADIEMVRQGIGSDPRIGYQFLYPGCGYGGSCFPKDVQALGRTASDAGGQLRVLRAVEEANAFQKGVLGRKVARRFGEDLGGRRFALWGLAFKPNTDDMREAPSRAVIADLLARGASVCAYDPVAMDEARRTLGAEPRVSYADSPLAALTGADALVIVTEWKEFRSPDLEEMKRRLKAPLVFDGRNLYDPAQMRNAGFEYFAIGRP